MTNATSGAESYLETRRNRSFAPLGLSRFPNAKPTAYAVGFILSPLCGWGWVAGCNDVQLGWAFTTLPSCHTAGCCWVMQWMAPKPQIRSPE